MALMGMADRLMMKKTIPLFIGFLLACSAAPRKPASVGITPLPMPSEVLTLEVALKQGQEATLANLKAKVKASSFVHLPESLQIVRTRPTVDPDKRLRQTFIRKFNPWSLKKKVARARELMTDFQCSNFHEAQALGLSLEINFPSNEAFSLAESLHENVAVCDNPQKEDSLLRLVVFSIYKDQCPKALVHLQKLPPESKRGNTDRISYLKGLCSPEAIADTKNPWSGYGIQLGEFPVPDNKKPVWFLSTDSGNDEWNQLLMTFIELTEKGKSNKVRHLAGQLDYEKFRALPYPFQASVLTVMHFAGADLSVFQALHKYLSDNPQLITNEVTELLFPVRFWESIVNNSNGLDPILVKSLIRQESAFDPRARSHAKAFGLTQVIFPTARIYGLKSRKQLYDPEKNIYVGSRFLKKLIEKFGSVELALAAYNAGPEKVKEWQKRYPTDNKDLFVEMIPYAETREYVRLVLRNYKIYKTVLIVEENNSGLAQMK